MQQQQTCSLVSLTTGLFNIKFSNQCMFKYKASPLLNEGKEIFRRTSRYLKPNKLCNFRNAFPMLFEFLI